MNTNEGVNQTISSSGLKVGLRTSYVMMAGIGIISLVFGGMMSIWLRDVSLEFIEVHEPRVELYKQLEYGLEASTAGLVDYVGTLSIDSKQKYQNSWSDLINPAVHKLLKLEKSAPDQLKAVLNLEHSLKGLALWQWHIEDVAATPGNSPAQFFLDEQFSPVVDESLSTIDILLDMEYEYSSRKIQLNAMKYALSSLKHHIVTALRDVRVKRSNDFLSDVIQINFIKEKLLYSDSTINAALSEQQEYLFVLLETIFIYAEEIQGIALKNSDNIAHDWLYSESQSRVTLLEKGIARLLKKELLLLDRKGETIQMVGALVPYIILTLLVILVLSGLFFMRKGVKNFILPVIALEQGNKLKVDIADLNKSLLGITDVNTLCNSAIDYIAQKVDATAAAMFIDKNGLLRITGGYALPKSFLYSHEGIEHNQGLVGQVYSKKKTMLITPGVNEKFNIESSFISAAPKEILISPVEYQGSVTAVIELATLSEFNDYEKEFISLALNEIGHSLHTAQQGETIRKALSESQAQSEELQANQEELNATNEALEEQKEKLHATNEELLVKSIAIEQKSTELEKANYDLLVKSKDLEQQALVLTKAESATAEKARQLEESSRYKSEFLANMSHELRTPLNSLLILARMLADNEEDNLDAEECESATVILDSGTHLLNLINDILDLSKIEAGRMDVAEETVMIADLASSMSTRFTHMAEDKGIAFVVSGANSSVDSVTTDGVKLQQILTNLIGNSIKFTPSGTVSLDFSVVEGAGIIPGQEKLLAFSVTDTGVGIEEEKQLAIFEAFQQEDGSTSRNFGGTGLGLSISLAYSKLLDGDIKLESKKDVGSTFTLYLPLSITKDNVSDNPVTVGDAANDHVANDHVANDNTIVSNVTINESDKDKLIMSDHDAEITPLRPNYANGSKGQVMLVEDDDLLRSVLVQQFAKLKIKVLDASTAAEATEFLKSNTFDCIVLDVGLPDSNGFEWLEEIESHPELALPPVIIYSGRDLTKEDELRLSAHTECIIIKSVRSSERLLDEVSLCLQKGNNGAINNDSAVSSILNKTITEDHTKKDSIKEISAGELIVDKLGADNVIKLKDKRVLVVDDDMRNTFALSKALRSKGMVVEMASGGEQALEKLSSVGDFDMVLMDIMMPGMDGYQTTSEIRKLPQFRELPIIAVTAKAMKGDKEKCMAAGANDYLSKPIDMDKLQSSMLTFV